MVVKNDSLYEEALEDEDEELYTTDDWIHTNRNIDPAMYTLASVGRSLETGESEQVKAENHGKAFMSGITLNNYDYQPDDMFSSEGVAKMIGEVVPFYLMWQAGALVGGRAVAALNYTMRGKKTQQAASGLGKAREIGGRGTYTAGLGQKLGVSTNIRRANSFEDTWKSFIPQVGIEAGLWTALDPTIEGAEGFKTALAYTALGQTLGVGLNTFFKNRAVKTRHRRVDQQLKDQALAKQDSINSTEAVLKSDAPKVDEVQAKQDAVTGSIEKINKSDTEIKRKTSKALGNMYKHDDGLQAIKELENESGRVNFFAGEGIDTTGDVSLKNTNSSKMSGATTKAVDTAPDDPILLEGLEIVGAKKSYKLKPEQADTSLSLEDWIATGGTREDYKTIKGFKDTSGKGKFLDEDMNPLSGHEDYINQIKSPDFYSPAQIKAAVAKVQKAILDKKAGYTGKQGNDLSLINHPADIILGELELSKMIGFPVNSTAIPRNTTPLWDAVLAGKKQLADNLKKKLKVDRLPKEYDFMPRAYTKVSVGEGNYRFITGAYDEQSLASIYRESSPFGQPTVDKRYKFKLGNQLITISSLDLPSLFKKLHKAGTKKATGKTIEVSTKGDAFGKQYSAKNAKFKTGKYKGLSIEDVYQVNFKGGTKVGGKYTTKNRGPLDTSITKEQSIEFYTNLWREWFKENPKAFTAIQKEVKAGAILTDYYYQLALKQGKNPTVNQADSIMDIVGRPAVAKTKASNFRDARKWPRIRPGKNEPQKLIARNHFQTKDTDVVVAVGKIQVDSKTKIRYEGIVDGGTGWAVQAGKRDNKPVFLWDIESKSWMEWNYKTSSFEKTTTPDLSKYKTITGIGTRGTDPTDLKAIASAGQSIKSSSTLKSGGADGADEAWEAVAASKKAKVISYIIKREKKHNIAGVDYKVQTKEGFETGKQAAQELVRIDAVTYAKGKKGQAAKAEDQEAELLGDYLDVDSMAPEDQAKFKDYLEANKEESRFEKTGRAGEVQPHLINYDTFPGQNILKRDKDAGTLTDKAAGIDPTDEVPYFPVVSRFKVETIDTDIVSGGVVLAEGKGWIADLYKRSSADLTDQQRKEYLESLYGQYTDDIVPMTETSIPAGLKQTADGSREYIDFKPIVDIVVGEQVLKTVNDKAAVAMVKADASLMVDLHKARGGKKKDYMSKIIRTEKRIIEGVEQDVDILAPYSKQKEVSEKVLQEIQQKNKELTMKDFKSKIKPLDDRNIIAHFIFKSLGHHTDDYGVAGAGRAFGIKKMTKKAKQQYIKKTYDKLSIDEKNTFLAKYEQLVGEYEIQIGKELDRLEGALDNIKERKGRTDVATDGEVAEQLTLSNMGSEADDVVDGVLSDSPFKIKAKGVTQFTDEAIVVFENTKSRGTADLQLGAGRDVGTIAEMRDTQDILKYLDDNRGTQTIEPPTVNTKLVQADDIEFREGRMGWRKGEQKDSVLESLGYGKAYSNLGEDTLEVIENIYGHIVRQHNVMPHRNSETVLRELIDTLRHESVEFDGIVDNILNKVRSGESGIKGQYGTSKARLSLDTTELDGVLRSTGYADLGQLSPKIMGKEKGATLHLVMFGDGYRLSKFRNQNIMEPVQLISKFENQTIDQAVGVYMKGRGKAFESNLKKNLKENPYGKISERETREFTRAKRKGTTESITSNDIGLPRAYDNFTLKLNQLIDQTEPLPGYATKNASFQKKSIPLTKELVQMIHMEIKDWMANGGHGNLHAGMLGKIWKETLKKRGIDVKKLPAGNNQTIKAQKRALRKFMDEANKTVKAAEIGSKPDSLSIIKKQKAIKKLHDRLDSYTGFNSKAKLADYRELRKNMQEYHDVLEKNGMLDTTTKADFDKILTGYDGLDKMLQSHSLLEKEFDLTIGDAINLMLKEQQTGVRKASKRKVNNIDLEKLGNHIEAIAQSEKQIEEFQLISMSKFSREEVIANKALISGHFNKMIGNDIAGWLTDGAQMPVPGMAQLPGSTEQLAFKQRFKEALDAGDEAGKAQAIEGYINYLRKNPPAFVNQAQQLGYTNKYPMELYFLDRVAQGLDDNLNTVLWLRENKDIVNQTKLAKLLARLEHPEPNLHTEVKHVVDESHRINRKDDNIGGGDRIGGDEDGVIQGLGGDEPAYWRQLLWQGPDDEFAGPLFKRYKNPVFLNVIANFDDAIRKFKEFMNLGDISIVKGANVQKIFNHQNDGFIAMKQRVIADPAMPHIIDDVSFDIAAAKPAMEEWMNQHVALSVKAAEFFESMKTEIIKRGLWDETSDLTFHQFLRRTTMDDPNYRIPQVGALMRKYVLGNESMLYKAQTTQHDVMMKAFRSNNPLAEEYLSKLQGSLRKIRDTVTNQGRAEANEYIEELFRKGLIDKEQRDLMTRQMVGDIPGYMPVIPEGAYLVQIKHYSTRVVAGQPVDYVTNVTTLERAESKGRADEIIKEYMDTEAGKKVLNSEKGNKTRIYIASQGNNTTPNQKINMDEIDMQAEMGLGDLKDYLAKRANQKGSQGISEYIGVHSLRRSFTKQTSSSKSAEEIFQRYAYTQGKDGFLSKASAEMDYARHVADKHGHNLTSEYIQKVHDGFVGKRGSFEAGVDDVINKTLMGMQKVPGLKQALDKVGISPGTNRFRALTSSITRISSFVALGFNMATALLQFTIVGTNVLPMVGFKNLTRAYSKLKHVGNPPKGVSKEIYDDYAHIFDVLELRTIKHDGTVMAIHQNAKQDLVPDAEGFVQKVKRGKLKQAAGAAWQATQDASMWAFYKGDRGSRAVTAIAARDMANDILTDIYKKMDKFSDTFADDPFKHLNFNERQMYEKMQRLGITSREAGANLTSKRLRMLKNDFAIAFTNKTNHSYNTTHVPRAFHIAALRPFLQFKTWVQKQTMYMVNIIKDSPTKAGLKEQYRDTLYVAGAMTALGGAMSLPGMQELDATMRFAFGVSPKAYLMEQDSKFMDVLTSGVAALGDVSLEGRMGPGNLTTTIDPANAFGIYPARLWKASQALWKGNPERAMNYTLPKFLQNLHQGARMAHTGELRATYDKNLLIDYNKMEGDPYYKALIKMVGFESLEESRYRNLKFALLDKSRFTGRQRSWTKNEIFDLVSNGEISEAKEIAEAANMKWSELMKYYKDKHLREEVETFSYTYSTQNPEIQRGQEAIKEIMKNLE